VYVLIPGDKGFEVARKGPNGFHTFLLLDLRCSFKGTLLLKEYRDDSSLPEFPLMSGRQDTCRSVLTARRMQAKGIPSEDTKEIIQERYKNKGY